MKEDLTERGPIPGLTVPANPRMYRQWDNYVPLRCTIKSIKVVME